MDMCRACLCSDKNLLYVDENFLSSYNLLTNINVKPRDLLPKCFCQACIESVQFYIAFREKCISSECTLQGKHMQDIKADECEIESINIKKEMDSNSDNNIQYELLDINAVYNIKKEEYAAEIEPFEAKERNPLETEEDLNSANDRPKEMELKGTGIKTTSARRRKCVQIGLKRTRRRPKKQLQTTEKKQQQQKEKTSVEYYCGLCDESFDAIEDLNSHLECHRTDNSCRICSKEFETWPKLLTHRAIHAGNSGKYCHLCSKRFYSLSRMEQHYVLVHFKDKAKEMPCEHCQKTFTCPEKFSKHLETHNVECNICPEIFPSRHLLLAHQRTHDPEKRYQCDQCEYTAIYAAVLMNHKRRRHKNFSCKTCDRQFAEKKALKIHVCKDKSKLCPICGQRIYNSFNRHMLSHRDARTFKCERCPASYKNAVTLKFHMDKHDNNPGHECDYCNRKFYYPTSLIKHRRTHTGEKPYACKICGKRFTGSYNLRIHMKTHGFMLIGKRAKDAIEDPTIVHEKASE